MILLFPLLSFLLLPTSSFPYSPIPIDPSSQPSHHMSTNLRITDLPPSFPSSFPSSFPPFLLLQHCNWLQNVTAWYTQVVAMFWKSVVYTKQMEAGNGRLYVRSPDSKITRFI